MLNHDYNPTKEVRIGRYNCHYIRAPEELGVNSSVDYFFPRGRTMAERKASLIGMSRHSSAGSNLPIAFTHWNMGRGGRLCWFHKIDDEW